MIIKINDTIDKQILTDIHEFFIKNSVSYKEVNINNINYLLINSDITHLDLNIINDNNFEIVSKSNSYYFVSRKFQKKTSEIVVNGKIIGNNSLSIIGGPCSVESQEQLNKIVSYLKKSDTDFLRGGIFKPRTSPYSFQGLGEIGLDILNKEKNIYPIVCELTSVEQVNKYAKDIDIIQIGARNMQNFDLLEKVAKTKKPIILKRGFNATIEEWLFAAEYIFLAGNPNIILCERGIRTFEKAYRNVTDLNAIVLLKKLTHLPVFIDPSHSTGNANMVESVALSCIMAGVDGILVETHYDPKKALSDGAQSLNEKQYLSLVEKAKKLKDFINNSL
ncbi:3-deoxy-7-phosphoheptulonate synthase [Bacilli bacterium PM5-3]|nr:3-deoxy-7-phosphoheptulonate synthase [Bacilli bacterium PM5-3]MDH6603541.1 3-deoxy-7-phosphoheptulonate synthase [Bacilli bacterium PM5-9]